MLGLACAGAATGPAHGEPMPQQVPVRQLVKYRVSSGLQCQSQRSPFAAMPFCDVTLALDARAADAVQRMTLLEAMHFFFNHTPRLIR